MERCKIIVHTSKSAALQRDVRVGLTAASHVDARFIFRVMENRIIRTAMDAIHHGAFDYLAFPAENEQILRSVRRLSITKG